MVRNWLRLSTDVVRAIIVAISIAVTTIGISSGLGKLLLDHSESSRDLKITISFSNHYLSGKMKITVVGEWRFVHSEKSFDDP